MTDDELIAHAHQRQTLGDLELRVKLAQARARILTGLVVVLIALVVLGTLTFGVLVLRDKSRTDSTNGARIESLKTSLSAAKDQLATATASNTELAACTAAFSSTVSEALSGYLASIGNLVVVIATVPPETREAALGNSITDLHTALTVYQAAIAARSAWQEAGSPLPCPPTSTGAT